MPNWYRNIRSCFARVLSVQSKIAEFEARPKSVFAGSITISGTATSATVTFPTAEPDTAYGVVASASGLTGTPAAAAFTVVGVARLTTGFTVRVAAAPGAGASVTLTFFVMR